MKLLFCPRCQDVIKLRHTKTVCECGSSWGQYVDKLNAKIGGMTISLGFNNFSFHMAIVDRPLEGMGKGFEAFVIPKRCPTIKDE